ncbi:MAG TPA: ATP-dependent DNA ligase [Verrucomicrobia bacterium]|nr:ATP-dependent DNA ligase [Verrucomicrobiota bacterium]HOP98000.1 non-homologous end-joining DNA ligase [Verrucomicrobiota bacterium]HPU54914.1 non-homologous end-joining DNA ligase [Verrucomicrobiota bacterium]
MRLNEYNVRRNFRRTTEPAGNVARAPGKQFFVVQKHDATRLHYDFRLAMAGVLKSWAVPKGFPVTRGDRRLAVEVEDHPIEYARFEGTIPEGNYGAGTVMVWDLGQYEVSGGEPVKALEEGKLHLKLRGRKLKGEWTLVRMRARPGEAKPQWLLLKSGGNAAPISTAADDRSVLTRRSLRRIAEDNDAQWASNRRAPRASRPSGGARVARSRARVSAKASRGKRPPAFDVSGLPKRRPEFVEPMKARVTEQLPRGPQWTYELKFDGIRGLAVKRGSEVRLISRNGKDLSGRFPVIMEALPQVSAREIVLDGEIVALDAEGRSSFQLLQAAAMPGESPEIFYYVFDLLQLEGRDLTGLPLCRRKEIAQRVLEGVSDPIRYSAGIRADSQRVLKEMKARGLEGLIAKNRDSKYEIGRRSGAWLKYKWSNEQEFVIGGYTPPQGSRSYFGAVLVGYYDRNRLLFASKVGTGFDDRLLKLLYRRFQLLRADQCPFANLPEPRGSPRWGRPITAAEMKRCTWLRPELVCQVRFAEWTRDGRLRQPSFLGLREDKDPCEVVRESA